MIGLIGKKIDMTTAYDDKGRSTPCTILQVGPCVITQIKTIESDHYNAIQLSYDEKKEKNTANPLRKHFQKANTTPKKKVAEFKNFAQKYNKALELGSTLKAQDLFKEGDLVHVTANSKGKGFQGVVKRHGFKGTKEITHGQKATKRAPGAIGACATPSRVFKNMKMAGQMGNEQVTLQNLTIIKLIPEQNIIIVKGSVPGPKKNYITLIKK